MRDQVSKNPKLGASVGRVAVTTSCFSMLGDFYFFGPGLSS